MPYRVAEGRRLSGRGARRVRVYSLPYNSRIAFCSHALAHTHARGLARCIMRRAAANLLHMEGSGKRWRPLAQIDVEAALRVVTPDAGGQGRSKRSRRSQG